MRRSNRKELFLKFTAFATAVMIVISSAAIIQSWLILDSDVIVESGHSNQSFQRRPCEVSSTLAQAGLWVSFDSSPPGTPAETHVTVSDTTGITIVADFYGFWRSNFTINGTKYDKLDMPGATSIQVPGAPVLPCLTEYVEIPHNIDVSIEVLASSTATRTGYNITPAPAQDIPYGMIIWNQSIPEAAPQPTYFSPLYSNDTFFPGVTTSTEGGLNAASLIMRGRRLLELSFYPVQFNPFTTTLRVYSQIVIKVKYSIPAQIQPIAERLRSVAFESILINAILNYDSCEIQYQPQAGIATAPDPDVPGAEYLIVTTQEFEDQADRLAEWKEKKGVPSEVVVVPSDRRDLVKKEISDAYHDWYPAPTYVLLLGDVEFIPANYDFQHRAQLGTLGPALFDESYDFLGRPAGDKGYIASDLGYFNIEGNGYLPDIIYGRISVDTEEEARIVVDKILQYEQSPPDNSLFYNNALFAGDFDDRSDWNGVEDSAYPFLSALERIRHYMKAMYTIHINYSCAYNHYDRSADGYLSPKDLGVDLEDLEFIDGSKIKDSIADYLNFGWLMSYDGSPYSDFAKGNITPGFNEGRFFVLYYGHGGSKNMIYPIDVSYPSDGHNRYDRDEVDGWQFPFFDMSYLSDLTNGHNTSLVVSIACDTGWFDGETDEDVLVLRSLMTEDNPTNPFEDYAEECFAEEITRLEGGGAVAAISSSRPAYAAVSAHLMDGLIQAFWPGFLESTNQPIYEMGAALLYGKLYAARKWNELRGDSLPIIQDLQYPQHKVETTFEQYHLFGDPETQLWTDVPSKFDVTHPISVGTSDPQKFVVTVRNETSGSPVHFAKVCIQQKPSIYQIGYTDPRGQVIFDISPSATPDYINLTVTKHNFEPYQGGILVKSDSPQIALSQYSGFPQDDVVFTVSGFNPEFPVHIFMDEDYVDRIEPGSQTLQAPVPAGPAGYVTVWAGQSGPSMALFEPIATTRFFRLSTNLNPDPYIYSQEDSNTWYLAGDELVWDNPCISIYEGTEPVTEVRQDTDYEVKVTVYNRGNVVAVDTNVTLLYSRLGGGVTWHRADSKLATIGLSEPTEVTFSWRPLLQNTAYLKVDLFHNDEKPEDMSDNVGYDGFNVIPLCSPGTRDLYIGNPTNTTKYVYIKVIQKGDAGDVWNATIQDYSSQAILTDEYEPVTLLVDPARDITDDEWHLFTVEIHINCHLVGGMVLNATQISIQCPSEGVCPWALIIAIIIIALVIIWWRRRD
ncbi:MAG: C25 family cysteine peptidase [Promethearchaeota archaeon]